MRFPLFGREEALEPFDLREKGIAKLIDVYPSLVDRHRRPSREGASGGGNRGVEILARRVGHCLLICTES